jgi:wyosine [tRNA(Phe)-imidazoG37] synthetase (radical SAM superfamily)
VVMASLDAATDAWFREINRPHPMLDLAAIIDGIGQFRKMFSGRLLMECFLVNGCNDAWDELNQLKAVLKRIRADGILINTLDRPGTEAWVQPVETDRLKNISDFLEGAEIVTYRATPPETAVGHEDLLERLVSTIRRRPYTAQDVSRIMGLDAETVQPVLEQLVASGQLVVQRMKRGRFYTVAQSRRRL